MSGDGSDSRVPAQYVAIGASAGGLEAIEAFFNPMITDSGLAFIVIQHLSPDYKSLMVELLSKRTQMSVQRAEDGMHVLPDHVYLIPPRKNLTIFHGKLLLSDQNPSKGINLPIDLFLHSLAEDQGEKSVAIILSGTGSDGTRGVRAIKEAGGLVIVQDEESAKFNGMPRAAASTGLADFILPPDEMPKQLVAYLQHPYIAQADRVGTLLNDEDGLTRIFSILRERCKLDFSFYKPNTVNRRIERRMTVNQIQDIGQYVLHLQNHPGEVTALFREILIGVTSFFRDPESFEILSKEYLKPILKNAANREIRFWVAGCSTGEEAYSLAITARECMEEIDCVCDLKIFATDVDREAILFAANGTYPESIAADVSIRLLSKYFQLKDDSYRIQRSIREMVVFAQHNLIKDPPFTNIDLISCRNLLIYLQPVLQAKVMESFNFSLVPGGIMFLGSSETTGEMSDFFEALHAKHKLYRSRGRLKPMIDRPAAGRATDTRFRELSGYYAGARKALRASEEDRVLDRFLEAVSTDMLPLSLIVNEQMEVLHVLGDPEGYLRIPSGKLSNDLSKMAVRELSIPLVTGIQKVFRERQELRISSIPIRSFALHRDVELRIRPLPQKKGQESLVAVFIMGTAQKREAPGQEVLSYDLSKETEQRLQDLEQELQFSRENLQATIEELETTNEELQATNEELLASNEELQSTNEELQSTNEELHTVNAEYHGKIIELTELHNDVDNLLSVSHIGKLLLDENLEIRRFSPSLTSIFRLRESDIGRPITHITHFLSDADPTAIIREVQITSREVEREVRTRSGSWFLMRVIPYVVGPSVFSGTAASFVDITAIKQAEEALRESQQLFATVANSSPALVWMSGLDKGCTWFNRPWLEFTGRTLEQEYGNGWAEGVHPDDMGRCLKIYVEAFDRREPFSMTYRLRRADGEYRLLYDQGQPRYDAQDEFAGFIGSCLDISERNVDPVELSGGAGTGTPTEKGSGG